MIAADTSNMAVSQQPAQGRWLDPSFVARPPDSGGSVMRFLLTGLAVAGLGIMAWNYFGPDLRRYLKIRSM